MQIGDLWVDPADGWIMIYMGNRPDHPQHYGFYCPLGGNEEDDMYYYSIHDLKYLEKLNG
tara:strand:+ start:107 stop:286 length:180 start_codon:yes stop_codon:yes gene_type:complete